MGIIGTVSSIIASIIIFIVLVEVYLKGPSTIFIEPYIYLLAMLIMVGLTAYYGYLGYARKAYWRMKYISPIALALGSTAILAGYKYGAELGGAIVFASYIVETSVGIKLYQDYAEEDKNGAILFISGVLVFIVSLPVILVDKRAALMGMIGDLVKLAGLVIVFIRLTLRSLRGSPQPSQLAS